MLAGTLAVGVGVVAPATVQPTQQVEQAQAAPQVPFTYHYVSQVSTPVLFRGRSELWWAIRGQNIVQRVQVWNYTRVTQFFTQSTSGKWHLYRDVESR